MLQALSGATRIVPIVGDPIAQVKSPAGVTAALAARGADVICVPMHVAPDDFSTFIAFVRTWRNCVGVIVTVPHKFAAFETCDGSTERASFLRTANVIHRGVGGRLYGDMLDGLGFVASCRAKGCDFSGKRALLVGAGGAGTAIAHAVASEGVAALDIGDIDDLRRDRLVRQMAGAGYPVMAAEGGSRKYDIVLNATPMGMRPGDPLPVSIETMATAQFAGDVITAPDPSPFITAARRHGCRTSSGAEMFDKVRDLLVDFLLTRS